MDLSPEATANAVERQAMDEVNYGEEEFSEAAKSAGLIAWGMYGAVATFNFLFYTDVYYRQYTMGRFAGWDGMATRTLYGGSRYVMLLADIIVWGAVMFAWTLTFIPVSIFWEMFYYLAVYGAGFYYIGSRGLVMLMECISFMGVDAKKRKSEMAYYSYFTQSNGFGRSVSIDGDDDRQDLEYALMGMTPLTVVIGPVLFTMGMEYWAQGGEDEDAMSGDFEEGQEGEGEGEDFEDEGNDF